MKLSLYGHVFKCTAIGYRQIGGAVGGVVGKEKKEGEDEE